MRELGDELETTLQPAQAISDQCQHNQPEVTGLGGVAAQIAAQQSGFIVVFEVAGATVIIGRFAAIASPSKA